MTDIDKQIVASVNAGLMRPAIEALLGITFTPDQFTLYKKSRAVFELQLQKKRRERKFEHLSNADTVAKHRLKKDDIAQQFDETYANIDWNRRKNAEKDLVSWVNTYCIGLLLDTPPPKKGEEVLKQMQNAVKSHKNYAILMGRGSGKSSYVECATMFAMCTGIQKFTVVVSANANSASGMMNDMWKMILEPDTPFSQDYPEVCYPFQVCNGSFRRRQLYNKMSTDIHKTGQEIVFATIRKDGHKLPTSGSVITVRGISSGLRGMKHGTLRPTLVLLDDLQDAEVAASPMQVQKMLDLIHKDIMCLGGKKRLAILQTATPIMPDDLVDHIKNDSNWLTTIFPGIISWPKNEWLWDSYFKIYDKENLIDGDHKGSLEFYKEHKDAMDEGSEVFNPSRYDEEDGHISAIQKLLELRHMIGKPAFDAEYQMNPHRVESALQIIPKDIIHNIVDDRMLVVPDGFVFVAASTDLNVSYGLTTSIVAFKPDMTAHVLWHDIHKCHIDLKLNDTEYASAVYNELCKVARKISSLQIHIDGWAIDAGGKNWDIVCKFSKNQQSHPGLPAAAFAGRSANIFNPFVRTRLRDAIGRTVLCGDAAEHVKAGAGNKYTFFDADLYKELVQRAFLSQPGAPGACTVYKDQPENHSDFAIQVCNETLQYIKQSASGVKQYYWKSHDPHDYLDTMAMCFAVASSQGISSQTALPSKTNAKIVVYKKRPKIRVV